MLSGTGPDPERPRGGCGRRPSRGRRPGRPRRSAPAARASPGAGSGEIAIGPAAPCQGGAAEVAVGLDRPEPGQPALPAVAVDQRVPLVVVLGVAAQGDRPVGDRRAPHHPPARHVDDARRGAGAGQVAPVVGLLDDAVRVGERRRPRARAGSGARPRAARPRRRGPRRGAPPRRSRPCRRRRRRPARPSRAARRPPSISRVCPVMKLAASLSRKTIGQAASATVPEPPERRLGHQALAQGRVGRHQARDHLGGDGARGDRVAEHPGRAELDGQRARERVEGGLGGVVGPDVGQPGEPGDRAQVDDPPAPAGLDQGPPDRPRQRRRRPAG